MSSNEIVVDPYSLCSLHIETYYDQRQLSVATAFTYREKEREFLISNWHVLSGRHPETGQPLRADGGTPNRIVVYFPLKDRTPLWEPVSFSIVSADHEARWVQHPKSGQTIDVAAIEIELPDKVTHYPINEVSETPDLKTNICQEVFIVGFPLGLMAGGALPIWKRASIASEPAVEIDHLPKFLVDTASRSGMSGSPVVIRSTAPFATPDGQTKIVSNGGAARKFLGIYSGRIPNDQTDPQLGIVWRPNTIAEIINGNTKGGFRLIKQTSQP